jgi:Peptidase M15
MPNDYPQIATVDGAVIGGSGVTYDNDGRATGQTAMPIQSWTGITYQYGSVDHTATIPAAPATPPYWSLVGANQSLNSTSPRCLNPSDQIVAQYGQYTVLDAFFEIFFGRDPRTWPRFVPNCFKFTDSARSANFSFSKISTGNPWALIKYPLVAPASVGYGLDDWLQIYGSPRTINSGYRTPAHNASLPTPGAPSSRHMVGDAIDFASTSHTLQELVDMNDAALLAEADFIENPDQMTTYCANGHPKSGLPYPCAHADWRFHSKGEYAHGPTH